MEWAREKIVAAGDATDRVQEEIWKAMDVLERCESTSMTVQGVYTDPSNQRAGLQAAREAIERAEKIMSETQWPTDKDYDALR
jgi:hypothetical protein